MAKEDISINKFYENKSVFITGATGFIGRLLVEKLLRSCPGIDKIYVLLRPKKGKSAYDRIKDIIDIPIFDQIRNDNIKTLEKIIAVAGNTEEIGLGTGKQIFGVAKSGQFQQTSVRGNNKRRIVTAKINIEIFKEKKILGISNEDRKTLIENVTIIFHNAASVRFDDYLKKAVFSNTRSAREIALLAKQLIKIDVLVDTSTAFSNCDHLVVEEKLYPQKIDWKELIRIAEEGDERVIETVIHKLIYPMPNTYTFTKALGEHAVVELSKGKIPCVILRPTIVLPTYSEPLPGWVDNLNGPVAMMYGIGTGIIRAVYGDLNVNMDHVFADSVIKALIIASWKKGVSRDVEEVTIYNITSDLNYCSADLFEQCTPYGLLNPLKLYLWPPHLEVYGNYYIYYFMVLLKHLLPAVLVDTALRISKRKPILFTIHRKLFIGNTCLIYFMRNVWKFVNDNYNDLRRSILPQDAECFSIVHFGSNPTVENKMYIGEQYIKGMRKYIAKEGDANEEDVRKQNLLRLIEKVWKFMWLCIFLYIIFLKNNRMVKVANGIYNYFENLDA